VYPLGDVKSSAFNSSNPHSLSETMMAVRAELLLIERILIWLKEIETALSKSNFTRSMTWP